MIAQQLANVFPASSFGLYVEESRVLGGITSTPPPPARKQSGHSVVTQLRGRFMLFID